MGFRGILGTCEVARGLHVYGYIYKIYDAQDVSIVFATSVHSAMCDWRSIFFLADRHVRIRERWSGLL